MGVAVNWEGCVDHSNEGSNDHTDVRCFPLMSRWNFKGRRSDALHPSQAHVGSEDENCRHVEEDPAHRLEHIKLELVDVSHGNCRNASITVIEQVQGESLLEVDEIWWWANHVCLRLTKAELEKVNRHECEKREARECQVQLTRRHGHVD